MVIVILVMHSLFNFHLKMKGNREDSYMKGNLNMQDSSNCSFVFFLVFKIVAMGSTPVMFFIAVCISIRELLR